MYTQFSLVFFFFLLKTHLFERDYNIYIYPFYYNKYTHYNTILNLSEIV